MIAMGTAERGWNQDGEAVFQRGDIFPVFLSKEKWLDRMGQAILLGLFLFVLGLFYSIELSVELQQFFFGEFHIHHTAH